VIGEIFSGVLSGAKILTEIPNLFSAPESAVGNGQFHLAIDLARFGDVHAFKARVDQMIELLKATPRMEGVDEILVPGDPKARKAAEQQVHGIEVPVPVVRDLLALAQELSLGLPPRLAGARM
jgi:LDH2 family malate/lactate/ureidoglycolate dehydrogenase